MNSQEDQLYPIELSLNRVKKTWGGWPGKIGEIWSLSCYPHESLALNGILTGRRLREIIGEFQQKLLGRDIELDPREPFPLLLKFISTVKDLPIRVHPDDAYTLENRLPMVGRNKIIYILGVKPGAKIYSGFREKTDEKTVMETVNKGSLRDLMNSVSVKPGEVYTVPPGRVHAVGKGVALLEIQRHSGLSFRFSDQDDKRRKESADPCQPEEALKIVDLNPISPKPIPKITIKSGNNRVEWLGLTPNFFLRKLSIRDPLELCLKGNRFLVYTGLRGMGWLRWGLSDSSIFIQPGQSILVPAVPEDLLFESEDGLEVLESSVPDLMGETIEQMVGYGIEGDKIAGLGGEDYEKIIKEFVV
ncbi:class I mannose-6-phosphate isomerase [Thermodesulfobacteriota bacterium]